MKLVIYIMFGLPLISFGHLACDNDRTPTVLNDNVAQNVIGGFETNGEIWRGVVGITEALGAGICNGVLIHPSVLLTAGHCVNMSAVPEYDLPG